MIPPLTPFLTLTVPSVRLVVGSKGMYSSCNREVDRQEEREGRGAHELELHERDKRERREGG